MTTNIVRQVLVDLKDRGEISSGLGEILDETVSMKRLEICIISERTSSRISSKLFAKGEWHNFFVVIGFDQLIHQIVLGMTLIFLL